MERKNQKMSIHLGIVGSREFFDYNRLVFEVDNIIKDRSVIEIVTGGAIGTDSLAERYAKDRQIPVKIIKPDWDRLGKSAGPIRNKQIVESCDILIAFWNGVSKGTKSSIEIAHKMKRETTIIYIH